MTLEISPFWIHPCWRYFEGNSGWSIISKCFAKEFVYDIRQIYYCTYNYIGCCQRRDLILRLHHLFDRACHFGILKDFMILHLKREFAKHVECIGTLERLLTRHKDHPFVVGSESWMDNIISLRVQAVYPGDEGGHFTSSVWGGGGGRMIDRSMELQKGWFLGGVFWEYIYIYISRF